MPAPEFIGVLLSVVVDTLIDTLAGTILGEFMAIEVLVDVSSTIMSELALSLPTLEDLSSWAVFDSLFLAIFSCVRASQAWKPSCHVCSRFVLPGLPHLLNQEPPRPQQLLLPDFPMIPHLGHTTLMVVLARAGVWICEH